MKSAYMAVLVLLVLSGCGGGGGGSSAVRQTTPTTPATPTYLDVTVPELLIIQNLEATSMTFSVDENGFTPEILDVSGHIFANSALQVTALSLSVEDAGVIVVEQTFSVADGTLALSGSDIVGTAVNNGASVTFVLKDPSVLGLSYSTLGSWEYVDGVDVHVGGNLSLGVGTSTIPTTGSATYVGSMIGQLWEAGTISSVTAQASAIADFGLRSVSLTTSDSTLGGVPDSSLDLTGTLFYAAGDNNLTGTLQTLTMQGPAWAKFYGPAAAELGGTFFVKDLANTRQMTGAFGLKQ